MSATPRRKATPVAPKAAPNKRAPAAPAPRAAPATVVAKASRRGAAPASAPAPASAGEPVKPAKHKPVRDGFTMPPGEYAVIGAIKQRALARFGHPVKKSEVLRAGLKLLAAMDDTALLGALKAVPPLKTGRPKKGKSGESAAAGPAPAQATALEAAPAKGKARGKKG